MDEFIPLEISNYFGLMSKPSKDKLPIGASSSSLTFHDIDLSQPGAAKTRGGSLTVKNMGYVPSRIWDWYVPKVDYHYPVVSGGTKVSVLDQTFAILGEDTGFTDGYIFDYLNYGDELFYGNGQDGNRIASIVSGSPAFRKWGIDAPTVAPTLALATGTLTGAYQYKYTYVNSVSGHESSASPASAVINPSTQGVDITVTPSADAQVDKINIYRTTNNGAYYFYVTQIDNVNTTDVITNGGFETWSGGPSVAPDGWILFGAGATIAREATIVKVGTYSAKLTRNGADCFIYQDIQNSGGHNLAYWKGRTVTLGMWVWASVANRAFIQIGDGISATNSSYHSGSSSWEYLTVTRTIASNATNVYILGYVVTGDTTAYLDGAKLVSSLGPQAYLDTESDTALGTTQAPLYNDPPPVNFMALEEWDGVIWGFQPNDTVIYFSNTEYYSVVGNPEESYHPDNFINLRAKIFGIRKSPNFNELWVHTSKGIYAVVPTFVDADPYRAVPRNTTLNSGTPYAIVNIYNQQWFVTEDWRVISIDSAGNISYESYNIETDLNGANKTKIGICQGCQYRGKNKNQFRFIFPKSGSTNPNIMLAANYLQRTPPDETGVAHPVWEYHKINAVCLGVVKDGSGNDILYTGTSDDLLVKQDYLTNDNGVAIDWSFELGWFRGEMNETRSLIPRWIVQYFNPLGNWSFGLQTSFDFGVGGNNYTITLTPVGDKWDIDFIWDISVWGFEQYLQRVATDLSGVFSHAQFTWSGNGLDHVFEMHSICLLMHEIEGFRKVNN